MLECPGSKIFKAKTGVRKPGHRPPVVALTDKGQVIFDKENLNEVVKISFKNFKWVS